MSEQLDAMQMLEKTSRTFYIPITRLSEIPRLIVASFYLCLRAIDEIEDHPTLPNETKASILRKIAWKVQFYEMGTSKLEFEDCWEGHKADLPEVSLRLGEWISYCPNDFRPRIADVTSTMSYRMADWATRNWSITSREDLDAYTMAVAGAVGLTLAEIWEHVQGIKTSREEALEFGRGLQIVNIIKNIGEDSERGVTFLPPNWTKQEFFEYSKEKLGIAEKYVSKLPKES